MEELDRHDVLLLSELQRDSRQTVQQLADAVGLSSTPCWKRIKEMESTGIIRGYTALIDREKVGLALCVIAEVNLTRHNEEVVTQFEKEVAGCPQIVSCYSTTGQADYVLKVLAPDIKSYERFLQQVDGIDFEHKVKMGIRDNRYDAMVPQVVGPLKLNGRVH